MRIATVSLALQTFIYCHVVAFSEQLECFPVDLGFRQDYCCASRQNSHCWDGLDFTFDNCCREPRYEKVHGVPNVLVGERDWSMWNGQSILRNDDVTDWECEWSKYLSWGNETVMDENHQYPLLEKATASVPICLRPHFEYISYWVTSFGHFNDCSTGFSNIWHDVDRLDPSEEYSRESGNIYVDIGSNLGTCILYYNNYLK